MHDRIAVAVLPASTTAVFTATGTAIAESVVLLSPSRP